jgi:hypothetical protein
MPRFSTPPDAPMRAPQRQAGTPFVRGAPVECRCAGSSSLKPAIVEARGEPSTSLAALSSGCLHGPAHPDYVGTRPEARTRFRYLLACLTKEIVQRTQGGIGTESVLESFIETLSHRERNVREPVSPSQRARENN